MMHGEPCSSESEAMVPAQQRHGDGAASLLTLELRRSTRSAGKDPIPYRRACDGRASPKPLGTVTAAAEARDRYAAEARRHLASMTVSGHSRRNSCTSPRQWQ